jgi:carboxypeptidase T
MNKLLLTLVSIWSIVVLFGQEQYSRVKIFTDSKGLQSLAELGVGVDHGTLKQGVFFISDFSASEIQTITNNGFSLEVLIEDVKEHYREQNKFSPKEKEKNIDCPDGGGSASSFVPEIPSNFNLGSMGGYYTYQEFLDELDAMAAQYPSLISVKAPISTFLTTENRPIYWIRISDNPNTDETDETEVLYSAIHHAREPASLSQTLFYMWYLLENYSTSEEIQFLVNNTEMYFVPCLNPDGYVYNETTDPMGGGMHRKNRRNVGSFNKGVDLNRNYSYGWGTTGVSFNPDDDTYPGTSAFSEAETQAMQWFCNNRNFLYAFNAHTYSNYLLYPIGTTSEEFAVDNDYFAAYSGHMVKYNGYANMKSSALYPASGDSDDYMYKEDLGTKPQIYAMTPEIGNGAQGFWPASNELTGICQDMVFPNLTLAHLTHKYVVVEDLDPSSVDDLSGNFNHSAYRLGYEIGNVSVSIEPLAGIESVGSAISYNLNLMEMQNGMIAYVLNPAIQFGDPIKYVLNTNYGDWTARDTITKTFGTLPLQYLDDATTNVGWTGGWGTTTNEYYSAVKSFTDSPTGNYQNGANNAFVFNQEIDLSDANAAMITFYAKWDIESDYDFCQFQVSTDGGSNWSAQCGLYTTPGSGPGTGGVQPEGEPLYEGTKASWVLEEINLSDYLGQSIKVRFVLQSDGGLRKDGFYFDDFKVLYNENGGAGLEEMSMTAKTMPNPAMNSCCVSFSKVINKGRVNVFDQTGALVAHQTVNQPTNKMMIALDALPAGVYTVKVEEMNYWASPMKLVVVH